MTKKEHDLDLQSMLVTLAMCDLKKGLAIATVPHLPGIA
jgi:hypothetical protein